MTRIRCVFIILTGSISLSPLAAEPANRNVRDRAEDLNDSVSRVKIAQLAAGIDRIVEKQLHEKNEEPNAPASDETFVRRIYLDIVGRIPTRNEALEFLTSESSGKRGQLIDTLLSSEGYVSHQYNYFADLLRIQERTNRTIGRPYIEFVKDALRENKHYDDFVFELLTATGPMMRKGNGATGYYMRDFGMPEDNMSNTIRLFLGTRLECAQCHDHPFDKWTQRDYYEMVAFNGGISNRLSARDNEKIQELSTLAKKQSNPELRKNLSRLIEPLTLGVSGKGTGLWRLPEAFLGSDGEPNQVVPAKTMFEKESLVKVNLPGNGRRSKKPAKPDAKRFPSVIPGAVEVDSREAFAKWVTSAENPRFATVIANRLWKRAFGIGVIEPVDEMTDDTNPSNPELMEYLTRLMVYVDFDIKQFMRVICNTRTYHRIATKTDIPDPTVYHFPGPALRRMTAEQMWDSLLTMTVEDLDSRKSEIPANPRYFTGDVYDVYRALDQMPAKKIIEIATSYQKTGPIKNITLPGVQPAKMNTRSAKDAAALKEKRIDLQKRFKAAQKRGDKNALRKLAVERDKLTERSRAIFGKSDAKLVRASELPSPAPPGHFVRQFGQSDREQIENSNHDAAVPQVLSLMNGFIEPQIADNKMTLLMKNATESNDPSKAIDSVFLTMLSRYPTATEKSDWLADVRAYRHEAATDLIWTLANCSEFMFVR